MRNKISWEPRPTPAHARMSSDANSANPSLHCTLAQIFGGFYESHRTCGTQERGGVRNGTRGRHRRRQTRAHGTARESGMQRDQPSWIADNVVRADKIGIAADRQHREQHVQRQRATEQLARHRILPVVRHKVWASRSSVMVRR